MTTTTSGMFPVQTRATRGTTMTRRNQEQPEKNDVPDDLKEVQLLTVGQVAKIFNVTAYTVRVWLNQGTLKGVKVGAGTMGHWRITRQEVTRFANDKYG